MGEQPANYARRMREVEVTVRELLAEAQSERGTTPDAGRADTVSRLEVGDRVPLRTEDLLDAADVGKLVPSKRWRCQCCSTGAP